MERFIYDRMAEVDTHHWWHFARRDVLRALIARKIAPPTGCRVLEVGCGTGHNLAMLGSFGNVDAVELDEDARRIATLRHGKPIIEARLPELEGVDRAAYHLVTALDVIEHVEGDAAALKALASCLVPGGKLLITVPAFPWMWSDHDVVAHHFRRYTKTAMRKAVADAGLQIDFLSWFNSILFPLAAVDRIAARVLGRKGGVDAMPPAPLNWLFKKLFRMERHVIARIPFSPGVSIVAVISAKG